MKGLNLVKMRGYIMSPKLSVTSNGNPRFGGRISIPVVYQTGGETREVNIFYHLCAWGSVAEAMGELLENTPVEIDGQLNSRKYEGRCRQCGSPENKYWTEVQVNNFMIVAE